MVISAFFRFSQKITAYTVTYSYVDGRQEETNSKGDYIIYGVIQPTNDKTAVLDMDGSISDGEFMLHTMDKLFFSDINNKNIQQQQQTFIKYADEVWKVHGSKSWLRYARGINKYIMQKYLETGKFQNELLL